MRSTEITITLGQRTGEISGDSVTVTGPLLVGAPGAPGVMLLGLTSNSFEATGQVQDNRVMNLAGSGLRAVSCISASMTLASAIRER